MGKSKKIYSLILLLSFIFSSVYSQERITDEREARQIFEEVEERRNTIETEIARMEMTITDSKGRTRTRKMKTWNRNEGEDTRSLTVFTEPGNVSGTAFLNIREGDDELQKLYLPSVGRIQTITASERSDRFMGSDFTFEDLGDQDPDDYDFQWLETTDTLYRVHANKPGSDQYSSVEFEIMCETFALQTIRYYNENDELIKRLEAENFEQIADNLWSPGKMTMYDIREDRFTTITWIERDVNEPIEDWRFTERGLRRGM